MTIAYDVLIIGGEREGGGTVWILLCAGRVAWSSASI